MSYHPTVEQIANALGGAKAGPNGSYYCCCPGHEDKKASLWIQQKNGGGLNLKCHAGCAFENIQDTLKAKGLWPTAGYKDPNKKPAKGGAKQKADEGRVVSPVPSDAPDLDLSCLVKEPPTVLYEYRNPEGTLIGYVARLNRLDGEKKIFPISLVKFSDGQLKWKLRAPSAPFDLYNVQELVQRASAKVLIVEGEKAADAGREQFPDFVVLSWRMGAGSVSKTDFSPLKERDVTLWPDADDAGRKAMAEVAEILFQKGAASVKSVILPEALEKGWDVADDAPEGVDKRAMLDSAKTIDAHHLKADEKATEIADGRLRPFILTAEELLKRDVPSRDVIVEPFLSASSLSMIYGKRGGGKTWVCLTLAMSIATGNGFIGFEVKTARNVLYVDGEMSLAEIQQRLRQLSPMPPENLMILPSEILFQEGAPLNLHEAETQNAIEKALADLANEEKSIEVIIFDNLSSLSGGVDENDNSALDALLKWLIRLRHMKLAVVLVHHTGKNGTQRGASRREDLLDTSIALSEPPENSPAHDGAHLVFSFAKLRGKKPLREQIELRLMEDGECLTWAYSNAINIDAPTKTLRIIWEKRPKSQVELAKVLNIGEAAVSHHIKALKSRGHLENNPLRVLEPGLRHLIGLWPELEQTILQQGTLPFGKIDEIL